MLICHFTDRATPSYRQSCHYDAWLLQDLSANKCGAASLPISIDVHIYVVTPIDVIPLSGTALQRGHDRGIGPIKLNKTNGTSPYIRDFPMIRRIR